MNSPHPNYTEGTQAAMPVAYNVAKGEKTKGEKIYDFNNYFTVGSVINLALSVAITEHFMHGKGKPTYEAVGKHLTKFFSNFTHNAAAAETISHITTKYSLLTTGGSALMLPMLWAENNKSKLTYLANRQFAPETIATDDPNKDTAASTILSSKFDENQLPQPVEEQTKHGVINGTWRRLLSVALVIGWGNLLSRTPAGEAVFEKAGLKGLKEAESLPLAGDVIKKFNHVVETNPKANRWTRWTITDIVNTAITTGSIWLTRGGGKSEAQLPADYTMARADNPSGQLHAEHAAPNPEASYSPHPTPAVQEPTIIANDNQRQHHALEDQPAQEHIAARAASHVDSLAERQSTDPVLAV